MTIQQDRGRSETLREAATVDGVSEGQEIGVRSFRRAGVAAAEARYLEGITTGQQKPGQRDKGSFLWVQ